MNSHVLFDRNIGKKISDHTQKKSVTTNLNSSKFIEIMLFHAHVCVLAHVCNFTRSYWLMICNDQSIRNADIVVKLNATMITTKGPNENGIYTDTDEKLVERLALDCITIEDHFSFSYYGFSSDYFFSEEKFEEIMNENKYITSERMSTVRLSIRQNALQKVSSLKIDFYQGSAKSFIPILKAVLYAFQAYNLVFAALDYYKHQSNSESDKEYLALLILRFVFLFPMIILAGYYINSKYYLQSTNARLLVRPPLFRCSLVVFMYIPLFLLNVCPLV